MANYLSTPIETLPPSSSLNTTLIAQVQGAKQGQYNLAKQQINQPRSQPERHSGYAEHRRACRQTSGLCGSQRDGGAVYPGDAGRYAAGGYLQPYLLLAGGSAV